MVSHMMLNAGVNTSGLLVSTHLLAAATKVQHLLLHQRQRLVQHQWLHQRQKLHLGKQMQPKLLKPQLSSQHKKPKTFLQ
jgi:hypothetical protein